MAEEKEYLTENQVIQGVQNYLLQKGKTTQRKVTSSADASKKEHGVDLVMQLGNGAGKYNVYFIEAKGNLTSKGASLKSDFMTNFRWAVSEIILRIDKPSDWNNRIYGIAIPNSEYPKCVKKIQENWAFSTLKIRIYGAYRDSDGNLTAHEYLPWIYTNCPLPRRKAPQNEIEHSFEKIY